MKFIRWIALLWLSVASGLAHAQSQLGFPERWAVSFSGADPTGVADSTTAVQNCLNSVGAGGACSLASGTFKILGNLTIPASTTLRCGFTFLDREGSNSPSGFSSVPAILLDSGHTISAGGEGATVSNCLIYRNGMTFPAANSSAYAGIALSDGGNHNFSVTDSVVLGFDTCIYFTGARPYLRRDYVDCNGVTKAAIEVDTGNTDSGYIDQIKIQPLATGNGSCTASVRDGTGFKMGGSGGPGAYIDNIIVQNFKVAQFEFATGALVGKIWADNINGAASCGSGGFGSSVGIKIGPAAQVSANAVHISQTQTGLLTTSNGTVSHFGYLGISFIGQDGLQLGDGSHSGNVTVSTYVGATIARYAINVQSLNSDFSAHHAYITAANGSATPYIFSAVNGPTIGANGYGTFLISSLLTDKSVGTNVYNPNSASVGFFAGVGSHPTISGISASVVAACSGVGSTGTCTLPSGADSFDGFINLLPSGSGVGSSGAITFNFPFAAPNNAPACTAGFYTGGAATAWPASSTLTPTVNTSSQYVFNWTSGSALVAGNTYRIIYHCAILG